MERVALRDDMDVSFLADSELDLEGGDGAAKTRSQNDDARLCHLASPYWFDPDQLMGRPERP